MTIGWQIPRNCLAWLLLSQLTVIAPHIERLPLWVLFVYLLCAGWRLMVFQGRWSFPQTWLKFLLIVASFGGVNLSYGSLLGLEPAVVLLVCGFSLKLLEVIKQRDVYVIIFLAYLLVMTEFIFSQDFYTTLYMLLPVLTITASLVALHQHSYQKLNSASLKKSAVILLQALPLMLVLFFIFPRFSPLWSVPLPSHQAKTGVSDSLSPGDVSSLSQSAELAFRVEFPGQLPQKNQLYWRGVVMPVFDGRSWSQGLPNGFGMSSGQSIPAASPSTGTFSYSIIQEASHQPFIFVLAVASSRTPGILQTADYRLQSKLPIHERSAFQVTTDTAIIMDPELGVLAKSFNTRLPAEGNPRARQLAADLLARSSSDKDFIRLLLARFSTGNFIYTLKPPLLGAQAVDEFLFDTQRGFCEHYASSTAFMLRVAGIPARVIAGYMGGELNPITGTVLVHQFDAHAWVEAWLPGEGWVRIDPTAAVSPERIELGLEQAMEKEGSFLAGSPLSAARYRHIAWLNNLRLRADAFNYYWASWVLNYRGETQMRVLETLLGEVTASRLIVVMLSTGALICVFVLLFLFRGRIRVKPDPAARIYLAMCKRMEKAGYHRGVNEGAIDFARRVAAQQPKWKLHLLTATRAFVAIAYEPVGSEQRRSILKLLRAEAAKVP